MLQAPQKALNIFILVGHNWAHWLVTQASTRSSMQVNLDAFAQGIYSQGS